MCCLNIQISRKILFNKISQLPNKISNKQTLKLINVLKVGWVSGYLVWIRIFLFYCIGYFRSKVKVGIQYFFRYCLQLNVFYIFYFTKPVLESYDLKWGHEQDRSFENIKQLISSEPVLKIFNESSITPQCDSLKVGLCTCLLQNGYPGSIRIQKSN